MVDKTEELERLARLFDEGRLTQEEFDRMKQELLASTPEPANSMLGKSEGWYPDPTGNQSDYLAYWNGQDWTGDTKPVASSETPAGGMTDQTRWWLVGTGVLMAVGSFMPWGQVGIISLAGTDGDGMLTLVAGAVIAIIGIAKRASMITGIAVIALAAFSGWVVLNIVGDLADTPEVLGSGLLLTGGASLFALIAGFKTLGERSR